MVDVDVGRTANALRTALQGYATVARNLRDDVEVWARSTSMKHGGFGETLAKEAAQFIYFEEFQEQEKAALIVEKYFKERWAERVGEPDTETEVPNKYGGPPKIKRSWSTEARKKLFAPLWDALASCETCVQKLREGLVREMALCRRSKRELEGVVKKLGALQTTDRILRVITISLGMQTRDIFKVRQWVCFLLQERKYRSPDNYEWDDPEEKLCKAMFYAREVWTALECVIGEESDPTEYVEELIRILDHQ